MLRIYAAGLVFAASVGCTRKPVEIEPLPVNGIKAVEETPEPVAAEPVAMGELCVEACKQWATTRFLEPIWPAGLSVAGREGTHALLTEQRRVNEETCNVACTRAGNRERAECLTRASNVSASRACFAPPASAPAAERPVVPATGRETATTPPPRRAPVYTPDELGEDDEEPLPS